MPRAESDRTETLKTVIRAVASKDVVAAKSAIETDLKSRAVTAIKVKKTKVATTIIAPAKKAKPEVAPKPEVDSTPAEDTDES